MTGQVKMHKHYLFALISAILSNGAFSFLTTSNIASTRIYVKSSAGFVSSPQRLYCGVEKCPIAPIRHTSKQSSRFVMIFGNSKKQKVEVLKTVCRLTQHVHLSLSQLDYDYVY